MHRRWRETRHPRRSVLPVRASAQSRRHQGSASVLQQGDVRRSQSRIEHSWSLEFEINNAIRRNDAVFIFHVFARAKIDSSAGIFNQQPAGCDVPQADSLLNVSVESSAGDISQVERSAAEYTAFAHAMNHLLKQREVGVDRLGCFGEPNRDDGFSEICAIANVKGIAIQFWNFAFLSFPHFTTNGVVDNTNHDLVVET